MLKLDGPRFADRVIQYQHEDRNPLKINDWGPVAYGTGIVGTLVATGAGFMATGGSAAAALITGVACAVALPAFAACGIAMHFVGRYAEPRPDTLRTHLFWQVGAVQNRRDSETILEALAAAEIVGPGRERVWQPQNLHRLDSAVDRVVLQNGLELNDVQRAAIKEALSVFAREVARRAPLLATYHDLTGAIRQRCEAIAAEWEGRSNEFIQAWILRDDTLMELEKRRNGVRRDLALLPSECEALFDAPPGYEASPK